MPLFLRESSVIQLSVYTVAVLTSACMFTVYCRAFSIASCSAWLLVHLSFSLYLIITLQSSNMLAFVYDMNCVISGVKIEFLYIISMNFGLPRFKHYTVSFG